MGRFVQWAWGRRRSVAEVVVQLTTAGVVISVVTFVLIANPAWFRNLFEEWHGLSQSDMVYQLKHFEKTYVARTEGGVLMLELDIHGIDESADEPYETREEYGQAQSFVSSAYACDETLGTPFVLEASACVPTYHATLLFAGEARATWIPKDGEVVELSFEVSRAEYEARNGGFVWVDDPYRWDGDVHLRASDGVTGLEVWLDISSNRGAPRVTLDAVEVRGAEFVLERGGHELEEFGLMPYSSGSRR